MAKETPKKQVALLLADGFEEGEAVIVLDILERLEIQVTTLACQKSQMLRSYHGIQMQANALLSAQGDRVFDAVVMPGGPEGSVALAASREVVEFVRRHDEAGKLICPLCSAAARVLGGNGLLKGRRYVCSGDLYKDVKDGVYVHQSFVEDGNLLSGKGLGLAFDFAFQLAYRLTGNAEATDFQADHIDYHHWRANQKI